MSGPANPGLRSGTLLGGRVRYDQFQEGYRTGIEPVLLAASLPARPGQRVLEAGSGAGAASLCLAARVAHLDIVGVEADPALAGLATANAQANLAAATMTHAPRFHAGRIEAVTEAALGGRFDHAMANPPWHDPAGTRPADPGRLLAKIADTATLPGWVAAIGALLRRGATLSLILPAGQASAALIALDRAGFGASLLHPFWPHAGSAARLVLIRARLGRHGATTLHPGLVLHEGNRFTDAAERILRGGEALAD